MSWREHWPPVRSSVVPGDVISGCRDNDTRTYRLFVNRGWVDISTGGHRLETCECCDLSIDDLKRLYDNLGTIIEAHEPWPEDENVCDLLAELPIEIQTEVQQMVSKIPTAELEKLEKSLLHGGSRPNSGRKRSPNAPRCPCGAMTAARAKHQGHKCQAVSPAEH